MRTTALVAAALFVAALASPAFAQKDDKPGHGRGGPPDKAAASPGKGQGQGQGQGQGGPHAASPGTQANIVINDRDRNSVYSYYRTEFAAGRCPPGLAKKNNGCLPPGQAKKLWTLGQPLAAGVVFYPLPGALLAQLTPPPAGYQYVRVANDVLMMATGTRLIAGAIADLGSF